MADDRKQGGEPALEFSWDPLELAADQTYSTTLRIKLTGWWEGGKPKEVGVSVYQRGQEPPSGNAVRIQKSNGTFPLTGLLPGHHYLVVCYIGDRLPVQKLIPVPELPKPERLGEENLEVERKVAVLKAQLERVKIEQELKEAERKLARELKRIKSPGPMAIVWAPAKPEPAKEEKKPEKILRVSLLQMIQGAYTQERDKGKPPAFGFKIQRRRPLIFLSDLPLGGQNGE